MFWRKVVRQDWCRFCLCSFVICLQSVLLWATCPFCFTLCSVVLQFRKCVLYASSEACFRCRRADGAMSVWSGPCPEVYHECYSELLNSLCCKLWNSSPWFPASLILHEVEEGMCWDLKSGFWVNPRYGQREFYVEVPGTRGVVSTSASDGLPPGWASLKHAVSIVKETRQSHGL